MSILKRINKKIRRKLLALVLKGDNVRCSCCGNSFETFLPFGNKATGSIRVNAMCPSCLSLERHRLLRLYLEKETNLFSASLKVLHVAPERVFFQLFSALSNITYYPSDLSPQNYPKGTYKVDVTNIPFENELFDVIMCNHVLEHIPDDRKAMQELARVLKPGGWGILMVPLDSRLEKTYEDFSITKPEERAKAFGQIDHVRQYGRDYSDRLRAAGFEVTVIDYAQQYEQKDRIKLGINHFDEIILVKKK